MRMMINVVKTVAMTNKRTFKNFGHKREPPPTFTVLWHGFLTFTFIGMGIEWKRIARYFFGDDHGIEEVPWQGAHSPRKVE